MIIPNHKSLKYLDLSYNRIDNEALIHLINAVISNPRISHFCLDQVSGSFVSHGYSKPMNEIATAIAKLIKQTHTFRNINTPPIWGAALPFLQNLADAIEHNPLVTYASPKQLIMSFNSYPEIKERIRAACELNSIIALPIAILNENNLSLQDICDLIPRVHQKISHARANGHINLNIPSMVLEAILEDMQDFASTKFGAIDNNNPVVSDVYRLVVAEKYSAEGNFLQSSLTLNHIFCREDLQIIADRILLPLLNHRTFLAAFPLSSPPQPKEIEARARIYWMQAYAAMKSNDSKNLEVAKENLIELELIPEDINESAFIDQVASLTTHINEYRQYLFYKFDEIRSMYTTSSNLRHLTMFPSSSTTASAIPSAQQPTFSKGARG